VAKKVPASAPKVTADKPSNLFRKLTAVLLVNSSEFAGKAASTQTATLKEAGGLPIEFVPNFTDLSNRKVIREKLLSGKDISRELEFNNVILTDEEFKAIALVKPVLAKIESIGPSYPWLAAVEPSGISFDNAKKKIRRNGHDLAQTTALRIWNKASAYWAGGEKPTSHYTSSNYYSNGREVRYGTDSVSIGCQTIPRAEVEYIARTMGWEPNVR
jgi:hypothetical protein